MAENRTIGVVDCPNLRMYADFLRRRGYEILSFMDSLGERACAVLLFCSDHLPQPAVQEIGRNFEGPKLVLNAEAPLDWQNSHRLNLPLLPLELEQRISRLMEHHSPVQSAFSILLIEDDVTAAMTVVRTFQEGGFTIRVCRGYAELASALQNKPDLIVMDLNLPGISGEKLGEMIRKQNIPVVIFSSETPARLEEAKRRIGAVAVFPKETSQRTMREWIRNYLQGAQRRPS